MLLVCWQNIHPTSNDTEELNSKLLELGQKARMLEDTVKSSCEYIIMNLGRGQKFT